MRELDVTTRILLLLGMLLAVTPGAARAETTRLEGRVVDEDTGKSLPCRLYVQNDAGEWLFVRSASKEGSAVVYNKQRGRSVERHTTLSAHPFVADLNPGEYTLTAERGKEYHTTRRRIRVDTETLKVTLKLRRWIDMAARGWYSGDTHVHRTLEELPNVLLAEDLNVAFPLVHWVTRAYETPRVAAGTAGEPRLIEVDSTHVIYPRNTEYEIFTVGGRRHTLGAVFLLGHKSLFEAGVPPVRPIAERTHREGGLIELDKHSWPWSMALVPVMKVDLYELSNNHIWRTDFHFRDWGETPAEYMEIEKGTERGWIEYGFKNYYALLNCGFRLRPTAGTASGVHPVPLGFGRVYVHLDKGFGYDEWLKGLNAGRSFVTTGPMLFARVLSTRVGAHEAGETIEAGAGVNSFHVVGEVLSEKPLSKLEVIVNGEVAKTLRPANSKTAGGAHKSPIDVRVTLEGSGWIAVRAFESRPGGRIRFAHTGPFHVEVDGRPLRPRLAEVQFLAARVAAQIERSQGVLSAAAIDEYRAALRVYKQLAREAR